MIKLELHEDEFLMIVTHWMRGNWKPCRIPFSEFEKRFRNSFGIDVPEFVSTEFGDFEHIDDYDELQILVN
jgi:hypothetical protein